MSKELFESKKFKKHATGVISTVNVAVGMLAPDLDPLVGVLQGLGKKHKAYGVLPAHFDVVGQALLETLGDALGDKFTSDVKTAWTELWTVISTTMISGM